MPKIPRWANFRGDDEPTTIADVHRTLGEMMEHGVPGTALFRACSEETGDYESPAGVLFNPSGDHTCKEPYVELSCMDE
jgi:hypothetical protein